MQISLFLVLCHQLRSFLNVSSFHRTFFYALFYFVLAASCPSFTPHQVTELLNVAPPRHSRHSLSVLGRGVCMQAFCRLLGLGKGRICKLRKSLSEGVVPVDGRFVVKTFTRLSQNHKLVYDFLEEIYHTISEPMPEVTERQNVRQLAFRKRRGKRPKVANQQNKMHKNDKINMRLLPPGTFSDYLALLRARHPEKKISLKLFSKAFQLHAGNFLCDLLLFAFSFSGRWLELPRDK